MFSLLTPLALWLAPLLAVPLVIHFMGRARPRTRDFPSLLPVRESLQRAMRRHRLKNWLQLILRTLVILCLLLAAARPVWRSGSPWSPPATAGLLLHNGAYAAVPDGEGGTLRDRQQALHRGLDSLTAGNAVAEYLLPETDGRVAVRFGRPAEAAARLLRRMEDAPGAHAFVPVFAGRDLRDLAIVARPWLEADPGARLVVLENVLEDADAAARLNAFGTPRVEAERDGLIALRVPARAKAAPLWVPRDGGARATRLRDGVAEILLPLPDSGWIAGAFSLSESDPARGDFAITEAPAAFRVPPPATLCHFGSGGGSRAAFASLASLGEGGRRLRVLPLASAAEAGPQRCDLLYLADPPDADAALLARAAAVIRSGGKVVLEAGERTDAALWNRNLLAPLGVGRFTAVARRTDPEPARAQLPALAKLGMRGDRWGRPGGVKTRIGFLPEAGTAVLLSASATGDAPLLVHRRIGTGELLLWTTSLSDPAWSDLGLGPWAALLHQAFLEKAWAGGIAPRAADTDSLVFFPADGDGRLRILDPGGHPFARLRADAAGWIAGPFDHPGLHRIGPERGASPAAPHEWLAVRLAEPPAAPTSADWEAFRAALGETARGRTARIRGGEDWRGLYGGFRLRTGLLVLAALLLFAEGIVSLRLSPSRD